MSPWLTTTFTTTTMSTSSPHVQEDIAFLPCATLVRAAACSSLLQGFASLLGRSAVQDSSSQGAVVIIGLARDKLYHTFCRTRSCTAFMATFLQRPPGYTGFLDVDNLSEIEVWCMRAWRPSSGFLAGQSGRPTLWCIALVEDVAMASWGVGSDPFRLRRCRLRR